MEKTKLTQEQYEEKVYGDLVSVQAELDALPDESKVKVEALVGAMIYAFELVEPDEAESLAAIKVVNNTVSRKLFNDANAGYDAAEDRAAERFQKLKCAKCDDRQECANYKEGMN